MKKPIETEGAAGTFAASTMPNAATERDSARATGREGTRDADVREPAPAEVDALIARMEQLYQTVTGQPAPPADRPYAPIPIESEPMRIVERSLDQLLAALGGTTPTGPTAATAIPWSPAVSVWDGPRAVVVAFDVPGVERDDLQVAIEGDSVMVSGRMSSRRDGARLRASERALGAFQRRLVLPPELRGKAASELGAELRDGRLELRFEKAGDEAFGRKAIEIR